MALSWRCAFATSFFCDGPNANGPSANGPSANGPNANGIEKTTRIIDFGNDVRPIFNLHCVACHGGVKNAGDFKITEEEQLAQAVQLSSASKQDQAEKSGEQLKLSDVDDTPLMQRVLSTDNDFRMPPPDHGAPLSKEEIDTIRSWIAQGARWKKHWAFEQLRLPRVPAVEQKTWPRQPIDFFVLNTLEQKSWAPSPEADPLRWLRRVSLAITGLPPTPEQIAAFEKNVQVDKDRAASEVVDQLLGSEQYGEHWASMWLDQVRYADSRGLGQDGRRTMWKYRDWVIDAFNRDIPFDRFTMQQIAGDLLPEPSLENRIATAAHRMTATNEEGGTDDEEFRIAAVVDRINTTWQVWQGMTFGCVQCHDHPYDPFRHDQYYQFMAYFNNTADWDLNEEYPLQTVPLDPIDYEKGAEIEVRVRELRTQLWQQQYALFQRNGLWQKPVGMKVDASNGTRVTMSEVSDRANEFHTVGTVARDTTMKIEWTVPEQGELTAIRITLRPLDPATAARDSEWGTVLSHVKLEIQSEGEEDRQLELEFVIGDEAEPFMAPEESLNEKSTSGFGAYSRIMHDRKGVFVLKQPAAVTPTSRLKLTLQHHVFTLDAFPLVTRRAAIDFSLDTQVHQALHSAEINQLRSSLAEAKAAKSAIPSTTVPVLAELPNHLRRPTHVFIRGLFLTKGAEVEAQLPSWMLKKDEPNPRDRLALAKYLVSEENPLTARVAVNRIWARLFGTGLVATEEDFGSSGEAPSHPELLDFMAHRFQHELGWSQKKLIRELVLSATFRQSSVHRRELEESDPANRWLARGPRLRLPAEVVRDQALFASGLLETKLGGPPVTPPIPAGVWVPFQGGDAWKTPELGASDRYRRSIYTYIKRSIPYPMLAAFDAPSREFCTARRLPSNTPIQALTTLNETTFTDCADALAKKICDDGKSTREQIEAGFRRVVSRGPTPSELATVEAFWTARQTEAGQDVAWRDVALLILNMDDAFTN